MIKINNYIKMISFNDYILEKLSIGKNTNLSNIDFTKEADKIKKMIEDYFEEQQDNCPYTIWKNDLFFFFHTDYFYVDCLFFPVSIKTDQDKKLLKQFGKGILELISKEYPDCDFKVGYNKTTAKILINVI